MRPVRGGYPAGMAQLRQTTDVLILGAGAAGMFCAIEAARRGRRVVLADHAAAPGEKIRISGGGRCNFTNRSADPERFLSRNPRFARSALSRCTPADFIARVDAAGIAWHEKTLGQLFCDGRATQITAMLVRDMADAGVDLRLGQTVGEIAHDGRFRVGIGQTMIEAESLVVATGGKSIPKMGATGLGYRIAAQFGLAVTETRPALVPLTFAEQELDGMRALAGVSVHARVTRDRAAFEEGLLFTHRGLSGPSILQISSYWREGEAVTVDLCPRADVGAALREARTMQARAVPGLYFVGEVVDVTGWLGGYNFQWAWSSGWAAGQSV
mgnify:CR=1 FL=1